VQPRRWPSGRHRRRTKSLRGAFEQGDQVPRRRPSLGGVLLDGEKVVAPAGRDADLQPVSRRRHADVRPVRERRSGAAAPPLSTKELIVKKKDSKPRSPWSWRFQKKAPRDAGLCSFGCRRASRVLAA